MTDGAPIDSVLFDPRLDPENPKSRKIIYDITKNMNKLTLADKYSAAAKLKKRTSLEYHDKQIKNSRHENHVLNLNIDRAKNIPLIEAYRGYESLCNKGPNCKQRIKKDDLITEQKVSRKQARKYALEYNDLLHRKRSKESKIQQLNSKLRLIRSTFSSEKEEDQQKRSRQLVNSTCKMQTKLTTAKTLCFTYSKVYNKMKSENVLFPKKIREINEEISDIKKEINTLKAAKVEANEELEHLHEECADLSHSMTERFKAENKILYKLKTNLDPMLRPHLISLDEAKTAMVKDQKKRFNSLVLFENAISVDEQKKNLMNLLVELEKLEKDASLIAKLTNISFDDPTSIGNWYKDIADASHRVLMLSKRLEKKHEKKTRLYKQAKRNLEQVQYQNKNIMTKKVKETKIMLNGKQVLVTNLKEVTSKKKILAEEISSICVRWLEKFTNYLDMPLSPQIAESFFLKGRIELTMKAFINSIKIANEIARRNIYQAIQKSDELLDLPLAITTLSKKDQRQFANILREVSDCMRTEQLKETSHLFLDNYVHMQISCLDLPTSAVLYKLHDPRVCAKWLNELNDSEKLKVMQGIFTLVTETNMIKLNENNARVFDNLYRKEIDDIEESLYTENDPNYKTAKKLKEPHVRSQKAKK